MQITLDKLQPIRADLLRLDTSWQEWSFAQLVQALREWTIRNPLINQESRRDQPSRKGKLLQINQHRQKCAYCNANNHSSGCNKITTIDERKKILKENKLCYNCTGKYHSATECRNKISNNNCNQRHHISFCNKKMENMPKFIVIYPVVGVDKWYQVQSIIRLCCPKFLHFFDHCKVIEKTSSQERNQTDRDEFNN